MESDVVAVRSDVKGRAVAWRPVRLVVGVLFVAVWVTVGLIYTVPAWRQVPLSGRPAVALAPQGYSATHFYKVLEVAAASCPTDRPFVLLGDDINLYLAADAYLYPRPIVRVKPTEPFGAGDLQVYSGSCLAAYLTSKERLAALSPNLTERFCVPDGCFYRVK